MSSGTSASSFLHSRVAAALVTGIFSLAAVMLGYWLGTRAEPAKSYDVAVDARVYPIGDTNVDLKDSSLDK